VHSLWYEELESIILIGRVESVTLKVRDMREGEKRQIEDLINDIEKAADITISSSRKI
jgi:hypothetical protein